MKSERKTDTESSPFDAKQKKKTNQNACILNSSQSGWIITLTYIVQYNRIS